MVIIIKRISKETIRMYGSTVDYTNPYAILVRCLPRLKTTATKDSWAFGSSPLIEDYDLIKEQAIIHGMFMYTKLFEST